MSKIKVKAKNKIDKDLAKLLEKVVNQNPLFNQVLEDISHKLIVWEALIGKELVKASLKVYLASPASEKEKE